MHFKKTALAAAAAASTASAQGRPSNTSICDYYTTALLMNNTAANQATLLTLVVNTAVIGNYTTPNVGISVAGILAPGEVDGEQVNLLPYFSGGLASTNTGGMAGRSVNFLDDGGAAPLMENKPSNGTDSRQYRLLTHLYSYFGALLGCTQLGNDGFPAYEGDASQYEVHKFMALSNAEVTYFIQQVALSAQSFGVAEEDLAVVGTALTNTFGFRCSPPAAVIPSQGEQLQSICQAEDCPIAPNSTCDGVPAAIEPKEANATTPTNGTDGGSGGSEGTTSTSTPTSTQSAGGAGGAGSSPTSTPPVEANTAALTGMSFAAAAAGIAALFL